MKTTTFRISAPLFDQVHHHLFPGDGDEHAALVLAGIVESGGERRFLAREVVLARDGIDFVPGRHGYRALTADFVARWVNYCTREGLCYFNAHSHGGRDSVEFSSTDLQSHRRGYPALLDITKGGPLGALVFAPNAVAGEIWTPEGTADLDGMIVVGVNDRRLHSGPLAIRGECDRMFHRQSLMFGSAGQYRLSRSKVGIIGLGGVGSLLNEYLARLGVGEIIGVDYDRIERSNRSRVVGARPGDCCDWLRNSRFGLMRRLGERWAKYKVAIAERVAREANPNIRFRGIVGDVTDLAVAKELCGVDFLFLAADSMQSRLVFNALVHQYLIPGIQIGSKVPVDKDTGRLGDVFSVARLVLPSSGCLLCNGLIPPAKLQEEALSDEERKTQRYVDDPDITAPSVITLNSLGAAQAGNDFLFHFLGLFEAKRAHQGYLMSYPRERAWRSVDSRADKNCLHCGAESRSAYARGDGFTLPCRG